MLFGLKSAASHPQVRTKTGAAAISDGRFSLIYPFLCFGPVGDLGFIFRFQVSLLMNRGRIERLDYKMLHEMGKRAKRGDENFNSKHNSERETNE